MEPPEAIYADGGCVGPNPSPLGVTWAFCWVRGGRVVFEASGVVEPADLGRAEATNNDAELLAACRALESVGPDWAGCLYSDSNVTICRLSGSPAEKLPDWARGRVLKLRRRPCRKQLLGGHPNKKALALGWDDRGLPVSEFQVYCDEKCTELAEAFKLQLAG